jgi:TPR repeat protein
MLRKANLRRLVEFAVLGGLVAAILFAAAFPAFAKTRHALIVGVSKYEKERGIEPLYAPVNDAEQIKNLLEQAGIDFVADLLRDSDVKDKATFDAALQKFLSRVRPSDEVLFYFSGHGYNVPSRGNYFLLPDAKSQAIYLKDMGAAAARALDTQDKRDKSYQDWISRTALSEFAIQQAIEDTKAEVIIIVADACRNTIAGAKGASIVTNSMSLPKSVSRGVFRLYSASAGQISLDAPERQSVGSAKAQDRQGKKDDNSKKVTSLFTRVLLTELPVPGLDINVLAAKVKVTVREEARKQGAEQIPDFLDDKEATRFAFVEGDTRIEIAARCQTAPTELAQLKYSVAIGSIGRETLERKRFDLAPCGMADEIESLLRLEGQGAAALSTPIDHISDVPELADAGQKCDLLASSPNDPNRLQGISGTEIQKIALAAVSGEIVKARAVDIINRAIEVCEAAVKERARVARFKFNLARSQYALATLVEGVDRVAALSQASVHYQEAVDLGYAAAYNGLGQLYQNGEFYALQDGVFIRLAADREKAVQLFERGAALGDILANYNLGMVYKNGENGVRPDRKNAFSSFSIAAEAGFVPAIIETALALRDGRGVDMNRKHAVELLEIAAARGSSDAMYWLGEMYQLDIIDRDLSYDDAMVKVDQNEAIIWHARAAEAGDTRAQEMLAGMLTRGEGLPAPQPEAAGRYWRLAAEGGSLEAQMQLANLIRDGKIPFRPRMGGSPDGGAQEIRDLYYSAFARGKSEAGLELARLYRKGFPVDRGSEAIPKDNARAIDLLWDTMSRVRAAAPDSADAYPLIEVRAAFELIGMYDQGEFKRRDGTSLLSEDQINQLKSDYGDASKSIFIRTSAVGDGFRCPRYSGEFWVLIWNWGRSEPPTEHQFDWFERYYRCKEIAPTDTKTKPDQRGVLKRTREVFKREFDAGQQDKTGTKTFVDRMIELVSGGKSKSSRIR